MQSRKYLYSTILNIESLKHKYEYASILFEQPAKMNMNKPLSITIN